LELIVGDRERRPVSLLSARRIVLGLHPALYCLLNLDGLSLSLSLSFGLRFGLRLSLRLSLR
jgi:hypothetical protein